MKNVKSKEQSKTRNLKVQYEIRGSGAEPRSVPLIRLCGVWLEGLGFKTSTKVQVETNKKLIVIRPAG